MIQFILNKKRIQTDLPAGTVLLDFIRYHQQLKGTKIGCREGDCGACTVLIGSLQDSEVRYRSFTSCLTPLGNVQGKHVVTIEGINAEELNPVQEAMMNEAATQCGFCTPGFVVSLTGYCLQPKDTSEAGAIAAVDGNICRCTGYKSIQRAAEKIAGLLQKRNGENPMQFAVEKQVVPEYFSDIKEQLTSLHPLLTNKNQLAAKVKQLAGGGTDLWVQRPDELKETEIDFLLHQQTLKEIRIEGNTCIVGPSATVTDISESPVMQALFPDLKKYIRLISSTPIRNMATVAGNFINASPIGDLTIFFLALNANVLFSKGDQKRKLPLRQLYKGYKSLDKAPEEWIEQIEFALPNKNTLFYFEKVSKRTHLDIASVNTALQLTLNNNQIEEAHLSAGGVGPVPLYLEKTSAFLRGKKVSEAVLQQALEIVQTEIHPITDARGTDTYKRLLLRQLITAHFIHFFPSLG